MSIEWIKYNGRKILYSDYSGLGETEMCSQLEEETKIIMEYTDEEKILYLANFEDAEITPGFIKKGNEKGKETSDKILKSAFIGVSGLKTLLLNTFNKFTGINARACKNHEDAKEFLVK